MNHHHANVGDVMKHLALICVAKDMRPARYLEAHAGGFDYAMAGREGALPDGVWDFLRAAETIGILDQSGFARLLRDIAGSEDEPGIYPGSVRCVWETLGPNATYLLNDTDTEALTSVGYALETRGAEAVLARDDGIDWVLDTARAGDLVLIDPFNPSVPSPGHHTAAYDAFSRLVERGVIALLWAAQPTDEDPASGVGGWGLRVHLRLDSPSSGMEGCAMFFGNVPVETQARVAQLAVAHGAVLTNGSVTVDAKPQPLGPTPEGDL